MIRILAFFLLSASICSCAENQSTKKNPAAQLDSVAEQYLRLGLTIGQYDGDFVDAYYGPDSLKPKAVDSTAKFPRDSLLKVVDALSAQLKKMLSEMNNDTLKNRANWMQQQLIAFGRRIKIFSGEYSSFDLEAKELFGVTPPTNDEKYFASIVAELDSVLPGKGTLQDRFQSFIKKFVIPKDKIDTVFRTAIAEARKRTVAHYPLPDGENFKLEYVTNKPWSGYNWYKGNYQSVIQINTDLPIQIERAIDLACHEGYPGHHVYNMLLEKNLYKEKGFREISMYPLFSPQSLIAEGSANYGIQVAFPGDEQLKYTKDVLLPLAGIDTAGVGFYFKALELRSKLNYARNEAARGLVNNTLTETLAIRWLTQYALFSEDGAKKSLSFIKKYRSYVINYNYGQDLVRSFIEKRGGTAGDPAKRWADFGWLLSNQVVTDELSIRN